MRTKHRFFHYTKMTIYQDVQVMYSWCQELPETLEACWDLTQTLLKQFPWDTISGIPHLDMPGRESLTNFILGVREDISITMYIVCGFWIKFFLKILVCKPLMEFYVTMGKWNWKNICHGNMQILRFLMKK